MSQSNGFASKEDFFAAAKRRFKEVLLPNGAKARIRSLTAAEWADIDMGNVNKSKGGLNVAGLRGSDFRLIVASVVDGDGNQIFRDTDIPQIEQIDAAVTIALSRAIKEHAGISRDVEDALKNFGITTDSDSSSSSAAPSPTT